MAGTIFESDFYATDYTPQAPSKSAVRPQADTRSEIELALADLGVGTKTDV